MFGRVCMQIRRVWVWGAEVGADAVGRLPRGLELLRMGERARVRCKGMGKNKMLEGKEEFARARKEEEEEEGRDGGREEDGQRLGEKDR